MGRRTPASVTRARAAAATIAAVLAAVIALVPAAHAQSSGADSSTRPAVIATWSYSGELVANISGGARRGAAFAGAAGAQITLLLQRLVSWRGARAFLFVLGTHGGAPSDLVGDVQGVSNLQAPARVRLEEAWLQQNLFGDRLSVLAGRYDLNTEFYRLQSAALFVNSSFGIGPELAQSGVGGPSIFPNTAVGARIDAKPSPNAVFRAAILDGAPVDRPGGGSRPFAPGDGALLVGEVALLSRPDTAGMPRHPRFQIGRGLARSYAAKLAVGGWHYTARFPDLADTLPDGAPVEHRGSSGAYLLGDAMLWSAEHGSARSLSAFVQLGVGDGRLNQIAGYVGAGLALAAPLPGRAQDQLGVAVAVAMNGARFERARTAEGVRAEAERALELTYLAQLGSWLAVQPDVQLVLHPGGTTSTRSALVPALRVGVSW